MTEGLVLQDASIWKKFLGKDLIPKNNMTELYFEVITMIEMYVNNITCSLKDKCYFSALALALALPDMCGMAEFPTETSVAKRYIEWFDRYLGPYFKGGTDGLAEENPWLSGEVVYNLRNTYLHQ